MCIKSKSSQAYSDNRIKKDRNIGSRENKNTEINV